MTLFIATASIIIVITRLIAKTELQCYKIFCCNLVILIITSD